MRMKSDEQQVLLALAAGQQPSDGTMDRQVAILTKFGRCGLTNPDQSLTKRGKHIAAGLQLLQDSDASFHGQIGARMASGSGSGNSGRNQAGPRNPDRESGARPDAKTAKRHGNTVLGDAGDLSGSNRIAITDTRTVSETPAVSPGLDAIGD